MTKIGRKKKEKEFPSGMKYQILLETIHQFQEEKRITRAFVEFCKRRYRGQNKVVKLDIQAAIERVKEAKLQVRV